VSEDSIEVFVSRFGWLDPWHVKEKWLMVSTVQLSREAGVDFLLAPVQHHVAGQAWELRPLDEVSRARFSDTAHAMLAMNAEETGDKYQS
jgi:hypothetical protein